MRNFGIMMACAEQGVSPKDFPRIQGFAKAASSDKVGRLLVKFARDVMCATGRGHEAPSFHFHFIYKSADWNRHCREVAHQIGQVVHLLAPMQKQAGLGEDLAAGAGLAGRGALYGSMAGGGGLGALYWLLSRHATQDESDTASMQHQIEYYNNLSRELSDSMRRKYQYEQTPPTRKGSRY